jgi:hypothetical protein
MRSKEEQMEINWDLKLALVKRFGSQINASRRLGIREARLSYIVRGHVQPSQYERQVLAKALGTEFVNRVYQFHSAGNQVENSRGGELVVTTSSNGNESEPIEKVDGK